MRTGESILSCARGCSGVCALPESAEAEPQRSRSAALREACARGRSCGLYRQLMRVRASLRRLCAFCPEDRKKRKDRMLCERSGLFFCRKRAFPSGGGHMPLCRICVHNGIIVIKEENKTAPAASAACSGFHRRTGSDWRRGRRGAGPPLVRKGGGEAFDRRLSCVKRLGTGAAEPPRRGGSDKAAASDGSAVGKISGTAERGASAPASLDAACMACSAMVCGRV